MTDELLLEEQIKAKSKWMYRALLMASVLEHLGYSTYNILCGDKDVLAGYLSREPEEIVHCLQMKGG